MSFADLCANFLAIADHLINIFKKKENSNNNVLSFRKNEIKHKKEIIMNVCNDRAASSHTVCY